MCGEQPTPEHEVPHTNRKLPGPPSKPSLVGFDQYDMHECRQCGRRITLGPTQILHAKLDKKGLLRV